LSQAAFPIVGVDPLELPDVQAEAPAIPIVLDEAGIADLRYPVTIHLPDGSAHPTVANASLAASVPAHLRGVHMSRFVECLHAWHRRLSVQALGAFLGDLTKRLEADRVVLRLEFPLFLERSAPMTGIGALVSYDCSLEGRLVRGDPDCTLTARVPITSLCPCSRQISDYGAHNQRGSIEATVTVDPPATGFDFTDLIDLTEKAGSAPIFSLLKRTDERYVTMLAYENPAFVEDIARAVAAALQSDERVNVGRVRVVNEESIHTHNAYAAINWSR
jgi:GTP cyclohydrolase FolE2